MTGLGGTSEAAISGTSVSEVPSLASYYGNVIEQIVQCVREGTYCALLGPRLSGKTHLLRHLDRILAESLGWTCIYIDLYTIKAFTLHGFFAELIDITAGRIAELSGLQLATPEGSAASSAVFRLTDAVTQLGRDLILIVEHLEAVPTDLVQALLTSLRAAYMDQQTLDCRVMVVISGALSLATLTIGESSPFRGIARRVFVGDLSTEESAALIAEQGAVGGITASRRARRRLLRATRGDPYLIRTICQRCIEVVQEESSMRLGAKVVRRVVRGFLRDEVYQYAPLQEAVRLIEEDPELLRSILLLLAHGTMPKAALPLPLSPDLDPLHLTGVVEQVGGDSAGGVRYRIQNQIYHRFLTRHFHPGHVGHLLTMAGRWDPAIDYLEAAIQEGDEGARLDLLPAIISSIYAAEDLGQAARFLTRGLSAVFGVVEARVWHAPPQENCLRMVGHLGPKANGAADSIRSAASEMPIEADRLEARAYRQARVLRGPEGTRHVWRAIPLPIPGQKPIGVVMLCDDLLGKRFAGHRERDLQLLGYLNQAARAMQAVSTRRQELALAGRMQASLLPKDPPEVPGWQIAATLRPASEASGDFYDFILLPGDRLGLVIADVVDKGMSAALYMALSRTIIRTYASDYPDRPDLVLRAANKRILADTRSGLFVTVFYGILDPGAGTLTYCNAGHYPPYLLGRLPVSTTEGDPVQALPGRGMALGVVEDTSWGYRTVELLPGAALLLYTDGLLDAQNPHEERFGSERVVEIARSSQGLSAQDLQSGLLARVQQFVGDAPQFDDMTLMTLVRDQPSQPAGFPD
jgi:serine phosphatase RsbU (regulator of sigma subunit)/energy-coupling factor transporter ATP-binding protein EcfA2